VTPRQATIYQLWCGEKIAAGGTLTNDEITNMLIARDVTLPIAKSIMRVKDKDFEYTKGQPFS
jgi:hypothetical protein